MKTVTKNNMSLYLFDDSEHVETLENRMVVGSPVRFIVADCNTSNSVLHEGVTPPADWVGCKYMFDGTDWTLNPDWEDQTAAP